MSAESPYFKMLRSVAMHVLAACTEGMNVKSVVWV